MDKYINEFGSFQNDVGKASASISLYMAYIFGGILIIIGLVCIWFGFKPVDTSSNFPCKSDGECQTYDEKCVNNKCAKPPERHYMIGIGVGLGFIITAILIIVMSKLSSNLANQNRGYAQLNALGTEANIAKNIFD